LLGNPDARMQTTQVLTQQGAIANAPEDFGGWVTVGLEHRTAVVLSEAVSG
jgi:hypothetical protein